MAERKNIVKGQIGNAIESVAPDHIATVANQIFDESRQEYQDDINENVGYNENIPEFVKLYVIKETNQILWGIQKDGNVFYGAGIPRQIKSYVDFIVSQILNGDTSAPEIDSLNKIINFLDGFTTSETLFKALLELDDKKVDKIEGKSLINEEYADDVNYINQVEFSYLKLTNDGRIVWGIQKNGNIYYGAGIPTQIKSYVDFSIAQILEGDKSSNEIDSLNKIIAFLEGLSKGDNLLVLLNNLDDKKVDKIEGKSLINEEYAISVDYIENPEFAEIKLNSEGCIVWGIQKDGNVFYGAGIPRQIKSEIDNIKKMVSENVLAIDFESNGDIVAYYGEDGNINDVYIEPNGDIVVEQLIN